MGLPIKTNSGRTDIPAMVRELKLGSGDNPSSEAQIVRYHQDEASSRIYRAEAALRQRNPPYERHWSTIAEVQEYVDSVIAAPPAGWHPWPCDVKALPPGQYGAMYRSGIRLHEHPAVLRELVVLHELAHHCTRIPDHGAAFLITLLALVGHCMGEQAYADLLANLRAEGVRA